MKTAQDLLNVVGSDRTYRHQDSAQGGESQRALDAVNRLFENLKMLTVWEHKFKSLDELEKAKTVWLRLLLKNNIRTWRQIQRGLDVIEQAGDKVFFPTPQEFIKLCQDGEMAHLGLPTPDELILRYQQFQRSCLSVDEYPWQSAVEYHLVLGLKQAIYNRNLDADETQTRAKTLISRMAKRLQAGEIPVIPTALLAVEQVAVTAQWAKADVRCAADLKAMMGCKNGF